MVHTKTLENKGFFDNICAKNGLFSLYYIQSGHIGCSNTAISDAKQIIFLSIKIIIILPFFVN